MDINLLNVRTTAKMIASLEVNTYIMAEMYNEIMNANELDDDTLKQLLEIGLTIYLKSNTNATPTGVGVILGDIVNDIIEDSMVKNYLNYNYVLSRYLESDWR